MIENLNKLRKKIPSREVLQKTKLGITLNKLRKHQDADVAKLAQEIRAEWKLYFKEKLEKPMIEVKSDEKTEKTRRNAKQMLAQSLKLDNDHNIVNALEKEVFHRKNRLLNGPYQRTIRALTFALRNKEDVRDQVASGEMGIGHFIDNFEKIWCIATWNRFNWRCKVEKDLLPLAENSYFISDEPYVFRSFYGEAHMLLNFYFT